MTVEKPYLTGHYTPVADEITAAELTVEGTLPPELTGRLIRNGHNPKPGVTPTHWFKGSGMVHGIRLREGRAEWYRNRWVHTPALDGAPYMTEHGPDLTASVAGTHVIEHGGRLLALCEANLPFELTAELDTLGAYDFDGKLRSAMTAHPKTDPVTGELHFFGSSPFPPYLIHHVADAEGQFLHSVEIPGATASLKHDFAITRGHVVFIEGTVTFDPNEHSGIPYGWNDQQPARIGSCRAVRRGRSAFAGSRSSRAICCTPPTPMRMGAVASCWRVRPWIGSDSSSPGTGGSRPRAAAPSRMLAPTPGAG
ncbi:retinal pigment epithelial membrane protein [Nocardia pseudobrasiliensis]|uniref:Dioxygenase n=1 Tax=Nocardia pseudobrasiliensis TaxID=45979 RepID=A0A370HPC4_9NOCA|nr:retinal pigment epithelial membrane protein [Nocardia pseudobrasiliensis]